MQSCPGTKIESLEALGFARTRLSSHFKLCFQNPSLYHAFLLSSPTSPFQPAILLNPSDLCGTHKRVHCIVIDNRPEGVESYRTKRRNGFCPSGSLI